MNNTRDNLNALLPDNQRKTFFGTLLRATSLDELPSLFNILKGDMAVIGPRPLPVEYLTLYNNREKQRHLVRPGLSGLAQINGRNTITWKEKFSFDLKYINRINFLLDIKIIAITLIKTFIMEGIDNSSMKTMDKFNGNN
jgi:lipopolysaccharide/colanic/teichoic acid biosynthesis glycosyltransferase